MMITKEVLDDLSNQAKINLRLRQNMDLRNSADDQSQRMLNALEPGTELPVHRHRNSSETVMVVRGKVKWMYYDDNGQCIQSFIIEPQGDICGLSVPAGQWHSLECLEPNTVIFECKDGKYDPLSAIDLQ